MSQFGIRARKKTRRASYRFENQLYSQGYKLIAGLDEVGRGAWAGPLVASAVVLPRDLPTGNIFDSKNLSPEQREQLNVYTQAKAVCFATGQASPREIEELGLTKALRLAYLRALKQMTPQPEIVMVDGHPLKEFPYRHKAIVKGDQQSKSIALASILAKQYRDKLMIRLAKQFPQYGFDLHKGYGTEQHQHAILRHGVCDLHRKNYAWIRDWMAGKRPQTKAARSYFTSGAAQG